MFSYDNNTPVNKAVKPLSQPVGIRQEHIADEETLLYLKPKYDQRSPNEYTIKRYWDDSTIFTVTGHKYGDTPAREFRDSSGLPMFQSRAAILAWKRPLRVRLPGKENEELVDFKVDMNKVYRLTFRNSMEPDSKSERDRMVTVEVRETGCFAWQGFSASIRGQKVVDVRESMTMNKKLPKATSQGDVSLMPRQVLEILVAEGFDLSLAALIAVYMADTRFSTAPPPRY
ncbi:hypothetical protein N7491_001918 [Penicillium cf. griseofulvum]|uniref:Uncharacterized protein n=1 Tax=Penicillium cf. griseofulvum TaxID=2972120 RepID=A0A9W9T2W2_9EURO|nr:hypothetical protein N7472_003900 [Penicillium cf. griseofulvum]KAJ5445836.1 hypothetical protein N7491_001918 [Penicillium cf. griseofulvum]